MDLLLLFSLLTVLAFLTLGAAVIMLAWGYWGQNMDRDMDRSLAAWQQRIKDGQDRRQIYRMHKSWCKNCPLDRAEGCIADRCVKDGLQPFQKLE